MISDFLFFRLENAAAAEERREVILPILGGADYAIVKFDFHKIASKILGVLAIGKSILMEAGAQIWLSIQPQRISPHRPKNM